MRRITHKSKHIRNILAASLVLIGLLAPAVAGADAGVTQAYGVTGTVEKGMIVMLDPHNASNVEPLTRNRDSAMQGVVVAANDAPVTLSGDSTGNQAYVATAGKYEVLVSNQNGSIKPGDYIGISALDGIGMKADDSEPVILGKALQGFDGMNNTSGTATLQTSNGQRQVALGLIEADIGISHNPLAAGGFEAHVPDFLRKAAQAVAGKPVSAIRIYLSIGILLATLLIGSSLLYSGVRSSLAAIGRNPLGRNPILRGLIQVVLIGLLIFIIGLGAIYLLLKA